MRPAELILAFSLLLGTLAAAWADDGSQSVAFVRRLYRAAFDAAHGNDADAAMRARSLTALRRGFDAPAIARKVLGAYWTRASASDRQMSIDYARDAIVHAMVRHLGDGYGEASEFVGARRLANGDMLVATRLPRPSGRIANLEWRVCRCASGPCITDIFVDGASLSIQRRDEFAALMRSDGSSIATALAIMRSTSDAGRP